MSLDGLKRASHWLYASQIYASDGKQIEAKQARKRAREHLLSWMARYGAEPPSEEERRICEALGEEWRDLSSSETV